MIRTPRKRPSNSATAWKQVFARFDSEIGITIVELLVAVSLMTIAAGAITGMLIVSWRQQNVVNADFRSQLDVRTALLNIEKEIAEGRRADNSGNKPIMQADAVAFPNQRGGWTTYEYSVPAGGTRYTILKIESPTRPDVLPVPPSASDKPLINVGDVSLDTTNERLSIGAPIFTFFGRDGYEIPAPVTDTGSVHSIKVSFMVTVTLANGRSESSIATVQINLRNF